MEEKSVGRAALGLVLLAAAGSLAHALWVSTVTDDAGISLAYARTFASGDGLRLTPLSQRVEAYSDPLWVLWLALGYALRIGGAGFARWSGALCAAAAVAVIGFVPSRVERRPLRLADAVAPLILAFDTTYNFWAGAGLESGAFALLLAVSLASGSAISAGLLCLLRPEGPLYVLALFRARLRWILMATLPLLCWLAFRRAYYGQWLPNAYYAKRLWDYGGLAYLGAWFRDDAWHWALPLAPLALVPRATRRAAALAALSCAAAAGFILFSRGDWMSEHRFVAHALPAAALAAGLVPRALRDLSGSRAAGWVSAVLIVAAGAFSARARSPDRKRNPELPLTYVADQGRWFRAAADRLGLTRPRIAHFDIGGIALESGGEVIDLAGLADLYVGRVGYKSHGAVRDYVFGEVKPELINIHGPCQYLHDDPRLARDYQLSESGLWGQNWVRKSLEAGQDDRCPAQTLAAALENATAVAARDLWLCARAHLPRESLPDVARLAARFAADGLREPDPARAKAFLDAAVTLDPTLSAAAQRLLTLRLAR